MPPEENKKENKYVDAETATQKWNELRAREIEAHNRRVEAKKIIKQADYEISMIQDKMGSLEKQFEKENFELVGIAEQKWISKIDY